MLSTYLSSNRDHVWCLWEEQSLNHENAVIVMIEFLRKFLARWWFLAMIGLPKACLLFSLMCPIFEWISSSGNGFDGL